MPCCAHWGQFVSSVSSAFCLWVCGDVLGMVVWVCLVCFVWFVCCFGMCMVSGWLVVFLFLLSFCFVFLCCWVYFSQLKYVYWELLLHILWVTWGGICTCRQCPPCPSSTMGKITPGGGCGSRSPLKAPLVPPLYLISYIIHSESSLATLDILYSFKYSPPVHP